MGLHDHTIVKIFETTKIVKDGIEEMAENIKSLQSEVDFYSRRAAYFEAKYRELEEVRKSDVQKDSGND